MMLYCDECGAEVPEEDAGNATTRDTETFVVLCKSCYPDTDVDSKGVDIDGGVKCQDCYPILFGIEDFVEHAVNRDCSTFTHSHKLVLEVDASTSVCDRCAVPDPEYEYRSTLDSEKVRICSGCLDDLYDTESDSPTEEGDSG